jgi:hypothetical protein
MSEGDAATPDILLPGDMTAFFGSVVADAIREHGYDPTDAARAYVVALLADFARPNALSEEAISRPLALLLDDALSAVGHERFERLRTLGDGVLYVSGFFGDHLEQRGVEDRYVSTLGARAYDFAARMLRQGNSQAADEAGATALFNELANNFRMFVALVRNVADGLQAGAAHSPSAMVRVYERWLRTGSAPLAEALAARGLVPTRGNGMLH